MMEELELNRITEKVIAAAIEVHRALDPGLLESTYHACLLHELKLRGIAAEGEKDLPVVHKKSRSTAVTELTCWSRTP
jgi:GxxExxY protein